MSQLTNNQKQLEIPKAIQSYLEKTSSNQAQLARDANVGQAYVTHIMQSKLHIGKTQIKDKYYLNLCQTIGYNLEVRIWRHFDTENFILMTSKLMQAHKNKERLVLDADTGAGKSYTAKYYKMKRPQSTFLVTCSAIENSKEFAVNIGEVVGVETHGTAGKIIKRVVKHLLAMENPMLIIDEAEHIGKKSGYINVIKTLADLLEDKVSCVLIGMGISDILQRGFERKKQNFRQTSRRFAHREVCDDNISNDIIRICDELGVTSKSVKNWLVRRVFNFGDLKIKLVQAIEEAKKQDKPLNIELLNSL